MKKMIRGKIAGILIAVMLSMTVFPNSVSAAEVKSGESVESLNGDAVAEGTDSDIDGRDGESQDQRENQIQNEPSDQSEEWKAGEEQDVEQDQPVGGQQPEAVKSTGLINYVGVGMPYLQAPGEQQIIVSFGDGTENIDSARISCVKSDGSKFEIDLSRKDDNLFLFERTFVETETGIYSVSHFAYVQDGVEQEVELSDIGINAMFGVNEDYSDSQPSTVSDDEGECEDLEVSVVSVDITDIKNTSADIKEAIKETEAYMEEENIAGESENVFSKVSSSVLSSVANVIMPASTAKAAGNLVVVLDPGHGGSDPGASGNGLVEKDINLKIAKYCKEELEKYSGVSVYMTRESDVYVGLGERVKLAEKWGADVFVCIHNNSANQSQKGVEIYYPNNNYNVDVSYEGKQLADTIRQELVSLGLNDRGIKIRNSTDNEKYPDGSLADYYSVIKNCKKIGIPGIIVEHAFISNSEDAAKLKQENFLKQLGVADATGIARAYGLKKSGLLRISRTSVENFDSVAGTFDVVMSGVEAQHGVLRVQAHVIDAKGVSHWYNADKQSEGTYKFSVNIKDCGYAEGRYSIQGHVWDLKNNLALGQLVSKDIRTSPVIEKTEIVNYNKSAGTFDVVMSGVKSIKGIGGVCISAHVPGTETQWYTAVKQAEGVYKATVEIKKHGGMQGTYTVQGYARDINGTLGTGKVVTQQVSVGKPVIGSTKVESYNANTGTFDVILSGVEADRGIGSVCISAYVPGAPTCWYTAVKQSEGVYKATVNIGCHNGKEGTYTIQGFVRDSLGVLGSGKQLTQVMSVNKPSIGGIRVENYNAGAGTFDVILSGVAAGRGIGSVCISAYVKGTGTCWYPAIRQSEGVYKATVDIRQHGGTEGDYTVQGYVRDTVDNLGMSKTIVQSVQAKKPSIGNTAVENYKANQGTFDVILSGVTADRGIGSVCVSVYVPGTTTCWYPAVEQSKGVYKATVDIANHKNKEGNYTIQGYVRDKSDFLGTGQVVTQTVSGSNPMIGETKIQNPNPAEGTFEVLMSGVVAGRGVGNVCISVYVPGTETKWYTAVKQSEGIYKAVVNISAHRYKDGIYSVQGYVRDINDVLGSGKIQTFHFAKIMTPVTGSPKTTVDKMVEFYEKNSPIAYPAEAYKDAGAKTLREFCELYYQEANIEGIRAEVAFAQAMLETGYLSYGGDVKIDQFNFAGLGATGNGEPGNRFKDVIEGIRAHIQHLKCYASTEDLKNECVDQRWNPSLRGKAIYVEWLSIPNNPYGIGWAADPNYAAKMIVIIDKLVK